MTLSPPHSPRHLSPEARLVLALRETPIIWTDTLPCPESTLSLISRLPSSPPFPARIGPYTAPDQPSGARVTYAVLLQLAHNTLIIRAPPPSPPILGLLQLTTSRPIRLSKTLLSLPGILLTASEHHFPAIHTALSRATSRPFPPPLSRFTLLHALAAGPHAKLYNIRDDHTGEHLVFKLLSVPSSPDPTWSSHLVATRAILHRLRGHPFLLDLRHVLPLPHHVAFIFEYCSNRDLFNYVRLRGPLPLMDARSVVAQLVLALSALHDAGACVFAGPRCGLRPDNVLVDSDGWIRLACFGRASVLDKSLVSDALAFRQRSLRDARRRKRRSKHRRYSGPASDGCADTNHSTGRTSPHSAADGDSLSTLESAEASAEKRLSAPPNFGVETAKTLQHAASLLEEQDGKPLPIRAFQNADLWNLGALTHFLLTGTFPFQGDAVFEEASSTTSDDESMARTKLFAQSLSVDIENSIARDFVSRLLHCDPESRLGCGSAGIGELRMHPWLAGIRWAELERRQGPYALKLSKQKGVDLLDLGERDIRKTFSTEMVPELMDRRDSRLGKLSRLFFKDSRDAEDFRVFFSGHTEVLVDNDERIEIEREQLGDEDGKEKETVNGPQIQDHTFLYGFGFSSIGPAFSAAELSKTINSEPSESVRGGDGRRKRRSIPRKLKSIATGTDAVR